MKDINIYNDRMRKSMMDKIFFMDKVDAEVFIDFGCADGSMIKMLSGLFPEYTYIGYDNKPEMISLCKRNAPNAIFYSNWDEVLKCINEAYPTSKKCLILSSVLHEVEDKSDFFEFLQVKNFDYVAIRDMFLAITEMPNLHKLVNKIPQRIKDHFGDAIHSPKNIIQGIFKSYYPENFDTEIEEDYFSFNELHKQGLQKLYNLSLVYEYHYLLPYWKQTILKDHGVDLTGIKTHVQLIYETTK